MNKKIKILREKFKYYGIDGYIVPKNDDYFTEYSKINRLKIISNFSGSAGLAVISFSMNRFYQGDWIDSMASRFIEELPEKYLEKNSFFEEETNGVEDFEFNQDFETEEETKSPGWLRYQKRIK